jgi:chromosomal replication initiation ATPase DnaA
MALSQPDDLAPTLLAALRQGRGPAIAIAGRSRTGKTTLLRRVAREASSDVVWYSAVDLVSELIDAIRTDRHEECRRHLETDPRPVCIEHLEDLRGKARTRHELRHVLQGASARRAVVLTLTRSRDDAEVLDWLRSWAHLYSLDTRDEP